MITKYFTYLILCACAISINGAESKPAGAAPHSDIPYETFSNIKKQFVIPETVIHTQSTERYQTQLSNARRRLLRTSLLVTLCAYETHRYWKLYRTSANETMHLPMALRIACTLFALQEWYYAAGEWIWCNRQRTIQIDQLFIDEKPFVTKLNELCEKNIQEAYATGAENAHATAAQQFQQQQFQFSQQPMMLVPAHSMPHQQSFAFMPTLSRTATLAGGSLSQNQQGSPS